MYVLRSVYATSHYPSLVDRERARIVYGIMSLLLFVLVFVGFTLLDPVTGENLWQVAAYKSTAALPMAGFILLSIACYVLTRLGHLTLASIGLVLAFGISFGFALASTGFPYLASGMVLVATLVLGGLLLNRNGLILGVGLSLAALIFGLARHSQLPLESFADKSLGSEVVMGLAVLLFVAGLVYLFVRVTRLGREEHSLTFVNEQLRLAEITTKISQRISNRRDLNQTLAETINHIVANYNAIYHAQVFLIDDNNEKANLVASTGDQGQELLEKRYSIRVDRKTPVGVALIDGLAAVERRTPLEALQAPRTYLPQTRAQAAFPLVVGGQVIGVLDLHSKLSTTFTETELPIFQILAGHTAIIIDNAQLLEATESQLKANSVLVEQTQEAMQQVEELNRRLTGQAWSEFLESSQAHRGVDVDIEQGTSVMNEAWTAYLRTAVRDNTLLEEEVDGGRIVAVPVRVRGQVIGAMEFELDADSRLNDSDRQLIDEVSERFGLAAENARLYEESRRIARREALINEAGTRLQSSSNVEKTLIEAARSLQEILRVNRVSIQLGEPPAAQSNGNGKDSAL